MLQIREIQSVGTGLRLLKLFFQFHGQGEQGLHFRGSLFQVGKELRGGTAEGKRELLHSLFALITAGLQR